METVLDLGDFPDPALHSPQGIAHDMHTGVAWRGVALATLCTGCSGSLTESVDRAEVARSIAVTETRSSKSMVIEHDFGAVLARGQILRHEFTLTNPSSRPLHIHRATAVVPCCSSIGPLPRFIAPGGSAQVRVELRPGGQSGRRLVSFTIETDDPERPIRSLVLVASLISEFEATLLDGSDTVLPRRRAGQQIVRIVCRRAAGEGLTAPESVRISPPLAARFVGAPRLAHPARGLVEQSRDVEVTIPAGSDDGYRRGELVLGWRDGTERKQSISWQVRPNIAALPPGIALDPGERRATRTIQLRSTGQPFRALKASGPALVDAEGLGGPANRSQQLVLRLDPARPAAGGVTDIRIDVDDPDQPAVVLSVLIAPSIRRTGR